MKIKEFKRPKKAQFVKEVDEVGDTVHWDKKSGNIYIMDDTDSEYCEQTDTIKQQESEVDDNKDKTGGIVHNPNISEDEHKKGKRGKVLRIFLIILIILIVVFGVGALLGSRIPGYIEAWREKNLVTATKPANVDTVLPESDNLKEYRLILHDNIAAYFNLPENIKFLTDYRTYIKSEDNSIVIYKIGVTDPYINLSKKFNIDEPTVFNRSTVLNTTDKDNEHFRAAYQISKDYVIFYDMYCSPKTAQSIIDQLDSGETYRIYDLEARHVLMNESSVKLLSSLPIIPIETERLHVPKLTEAEPYREIEDTVYASRLVYIFEEAIRRAAVTGVIVSGSPTAKTFYIDPDKCFIEFNNVSFGLVKVNYNTTIEVMGFGDLGRTSVLYYLNGV